MQNPIQYLHEFVQWCHMRKEEFWEVVKLSKEQLLRTNDPQYDDGVPSDISAQPYVVNYKNRRHIYIYSKAPWPVVLKDNSGEWSTTLLPRTWTNVDFPNGTRLLAVNPVPGTPVTIKALCTDEFVQGIPNPAYLKTVVSTSTTTVIKTGSGFLHTFIVGEPGNSWTVSFYDNTTGTGTPFSVQNLINSDTGILYDCWFQNGLTIVTAGTTPGNITFTWY